MAGAWHKTHAPVLLFFAMTALGQGQSWVWAGTREEGGGSLFHGAKPCNTV